jgi:hypothetical protein
MGNPPASGAGVGLVLNATASSITGVAISPSGSGAAAGGWTLFPASLPSGTSTLQGCSFPIPQGTTFDVSVQFDTGEKPIGTVSNAGTASPAVVVVAFLNLLVAVRPNGRAFQLLAARSALTGMMLSEESS